MKPLIALCFDWPTHRHWDALLRRSKACGSFKVKEFTGELFITR